MIVQQYKNGHAKDSLMTSQNTFVAATSKASMSSEVGFHVSCISSSGRMKLLNIFFASFTFLELGSNEAILNASVSITLASCEVLMTMRSLPAWRGQGGKAFPSSLVFVALLASVELELEVELEDELGVDSIPTPLVSLGSSVFSVNFAAGPVATCRSSGSFSSSSLIRRGGARFTCVVVSYFCKTTSTFGDSFGGTCQRGNAGIASGPHGLFHL